MKDSILIFNSGDTHRIVASGRIWSFDSGMLRKDRGNEERFKINFFDIDYFCCKQLKLDGKWSGREGPKRGL